VIDNLSDLFILRGIPGHIRSDNGPEFVAGTVQKKWITAAGAKTAYIERGRPWENDYIESFNARLRDELLNGEIFYTLREAQIVIKACDATTTRSGLTRRSDTSRRHQKCSCLPSGCGRLRFSTGCAGHAGATADLKLTLNTNHSVGADHRLRPLRR
jgi:transposase InsO family protein